VIVYGDSLQNCTVALIVVEVPEMKKWADANGGGDAINNPAFKKHVHDSMMQLAVTNKFSSLEKPRDITLMLDPFTPENGLMTPTFKLKRNVVRDKFRPEIDAMYAELKKKGF
jgi:long-chain acyl-CoA synthetase